MKKHRMLGGRVRKTLLRREALVLVHCNYMYNYMYFELNAR